MQMMFTDEERNWLDNEPLNWHVKDGAPAHIRSSLEMKLHCMEEAEFDQMRARVANASQAEKDWMEAEIARMKELRKNQREKME